MPIKLTKRNVDAAGAGDGDTFLWDTELAPGEVAFTAPPA